MTDAGIDRRRVLIVGLVSSVLITAAGLAAWTAGGDVPRGTRVLGVELGGRSRTDAERALHDAFDARAGEPVAVEVRGARRSVDPADIGLTLDVDLSVGRAIRAGGPLLFGRRDCPPVIHVDRAKLRTVLHDPGHLGVAAAAVKGAWLTGGVAVIG